MDKENILTQSRLKEVLYYNPDDGNFTWTYSNRARKEGGLAGSVNSNGYSVIGIDGKIYRAHRLAWLYVNGHFPTWQIDHIDGIRDNNKLSNLRVVSNLENHKNKKMHSNNTSGISGVCWSKLSGKWLSRIQVDGRRVHLGIFNDISDAISSRSKAEIEFGFHKNSGRLS